MLGRCRSVCLQRATNIVATESSVEAYKAIHVVYLNGIGSENMCIPTKQVLAELHDKLSDCLLFIFIRANVNITHLMNMHNIHIVVKRVVGYTYIFIYMVCCKKRPAFRVVLLIFMRLLLLEDFVFECIYIYIYISIQARLL